MKSFLKLKSSFKWLLAILVLVITMFIIQINLNFSADSTARNARIIISWDEGGVTKTQDYNTFLSSAVPALVQPLVIPKAPTVTTSAPTLITETSATFQGNVTNQGSDVVTSRGFYYTVDTSTSHDCVGVSGGTLVNYDPAGIGSFDKMVDGLLKDTHYCNKAFATNSVGTGDGAWISFKTNTPTVIEGTQIKPTVKTTTSTDIKDTSATFQGNVIDKGSSDVASYGFYYTTDISTDHNCAGATDDTQVIVGTTNVGTFYKPVTSLTIGTSYCNRAFATNAAGTGYGVWKNFTTTAPTDTPPGTIFSFYFYDKDGQYIDKAGGKVRATVYVPCNYSDGSRTVTTNTNFIMTATLTATGKFTLFDTDIAKIVRTTSICPPKIWADASHEATFTSVSNTGPWSVAFEATDPVGVVDVVDGYGQLVDVANFPMITLNKADYISSTMPYLGTTHDLAYGTAYYEAKSKTLKNVFSYNVNEHHSVNLFCRPPIEVCGIFCLTANAWDTQPPIFKAFILTVADFAGGPLVHILVSSGLFIDLVTN